MLYKQKIVKCYFTYIKSSYVNADELAALLTQWIKTPTPKDYEV